MGAALDHSAYTPTVYRRTKVLSAVSGHQPPIPAVGQRRKPKLYTTGIAEDRHHPPGASGVEHVAEEVDHAGVPHLLFHLWGDRRCTPDLSDAVRFRGRGARGNAELVGG